MNVICVGGVGPYGGSEGYVKRVIPNLTTTLEAASLRLPTKRLLYWCWVTWRWITSASMGLEWT